MQTLVPQAKPVCVSSTPCADTGTLVADGSKFDSSVDKGRPFIFKIGLGMVIKGWDEGVMKMSLGEKSVLTMTPDFGYGERGGASRLQDLWMACALLSRLLLTQRSPGRYSLWQRAASFRRMQI